MNMAGKLVKTAALSAYPSAYPEFVAADELLIPGPFQYPFA
jgi:hypothetical protein